MEAKTNMSSVHNLPSKGKVEVGVDQRYKIKAKVIGNFDEVIC